MGEKDGLKFSCHSDYGVSTYGWAKGSPCFLPAPALSGEAGAKIMAMPCNSSKRTLLSILLTDLY